MRHIVLGTAGHIDHGKSALVKALTGIDPDRLKEEKERGITIDLGFANITYEDLTVGIVDVPGHERLIKNMLAGAGGIDIVLFVIAADEGIMPQSVEHLAICNLLDIKSGLTAITKTDLVDADWLELVGEETREFVKGTFLESSEIIPVSAKTGYNIDLLKEKIQEISYKTLPKSTGGLFRLPVDRVFSLKGFGTVVTGTALSGAIRVDEGVEILPSGLRGKVRGLQNHGYSIGEAHAGQRVAINLQGIDKDRVQRGDTIVQTDKFKHTAKIDTFVELLKSSPIVKNGNLIHFHTGTSETVARIVLYNNKSKLLPGESSFCQLRLKKPLIGMNSDRFILRRFSPLETIGGGVILDPFPPKRKKKDGTKSLEIYIKGSLKEKVLEKIKESGIVGIRQESLEGWINEEISNIKEAIKSLKDTSKIIYLNETLFENKVIESTKRKILETLSDFHKKYPLKPGMLKEDLKSRLKDLSAKTFVSLLPSINSIVVEKELVRLKEFKPTLSVIDESIKINVVSLLEKAGFQPPLRSDIARALSIKEKQVEDILKLLAKSGNIVRINDSVYILKETYDKMMNHLKGFSEDKKEMTVAEFRDLLGTTRKFALPYLEYLDSNKITLRVGEKRKILI